MHTCTCTTQHTHTVLPCYWNSNIYKGRDMRNWNAPAVRKAWLGRVQIIITMNQEHCPCLLPSIMVSHSGILRNCGQECDAQGRTVVNCWPGCAEYSFNLRKNWGACFRPCRSIIAFNICIRCACANRLLMPNTSCSGIACARETKSLTPKAV